MKETGEYANPHRLLNTVVSHYYSQRISSALYFESNE